MLEFQSFMAATGEGFALMQRYSPPCFSDFCRQLYLIYCMEKRKVIKEQKSAVLNADTWI
jgi:hypothetical protein